MQYSLAAHDYTAGLYFDILHNHSVHAKYMPKDGYPFNVVHVVEHMFLPQGTLLFDYGSDLDSGASVLGDPAGTRGKPGNGWGYGAGIRIDSPVGPLRLEYAWNKQGRSRVHLGIGAHG